VINERILELFAEHADQYVSGEELSRRLGMSRTAIWKHIESLRKEGYLFEAVSRKGYRLLQKPERVNAVKLLDGLETKLMGQKLHIFDQVDSTMTVAHRLVTEGAPEGTLVVAEEQNAGRGRMGRKWLSPRGKGIYMSLILKPRVPVFFTPQLTLLTAVAVCRAVRKFTGLDIGIKWPNDLLIGGKKLCGILLEISGDDERLTYVIAGIGISANFLPEDYPEELRKIATSIAIEKGETISREALIQAILKDFEELYELYHEQGFAPIRLLWEALSVSLHKTIRVISPTGEWVEGAAEAIDDSGALNVRTPDGNMYRIFSGEVELKH
jgi:BirA family transcriptional regulator, biotin operon repressor / biotin---[acetyl-CoA-carboxylase] ligase